MGSTVCRWHVSVATWLTATAVFVTRPSILAAQAPPARWTVDPTPTVSIGEAQGPPEYLLDSPREVTVLAHGTIVIQNSFRGVFEIRYYDARGKYLRTVSRWGEGPYEFHARTWAHRLGPDSLLVLDNGGRFAVFGPRGEPVREGRLDVQALQPVGVTVRVDDHHLAVLRSNGKPGIPSGMVRGSADVLFLNLDTGEAERVGTLPDRTAFFQRAGRGVWIYQSPFAPEGFIAGGGGLLWMGDSAADSIVAYRPGVRGPVRTVHVGFPRVRVTREDRSRLRDLFSHFSGDRGKRWARYARSMDFPDVMPRFGRLEVDRDGNLWVQEYEVPWKEGSQHWEVYSEAGAHIADVSVPVPALSWCARGGTGPCYLRQAPLEIGDDYILVAERGPMDVFVVREFAIHKGR
ncbi:MAG: hypothetical protein LJF06_09780 [Gemmatimonadetes bacterium]|nr:hypothetical protein [Gemmatimonadota bacterium]